MEKYETTFSLEFIIKKIALRECLLCENNLDENIGKGKWHIPLCKKHRIEYLEEEFKEMEKGEEYKKWNKKKENKF
jgi:hypothetical protein